MNNQQVDKNNKDDEVSKSSSTKKPQPDPAPDSPMGKFNKAMQKFLSAPKKNLKDK